MILWWMELHFISTSIICIMCFFPIMAPNTRCWWLSLNKSVPWTTGTWNNGEWLCNFTWNSLCWRCFLALLDFSSSTFFAFFLIFCLDNLRLFEVAVMSRSFRFLCNLSSLLKKFSNPFDWFIGGNLSACCCPRNQRISFSEIQRCYCWHNRSSYATTNSVHRTQTWI